jgi:hypothetical protein
MACHTYKQHTHTHAYTHIYIYTHTLPVQLMIDDRLAVVQSSLDCLADASSTYEQLASSSRAAVLALQHEEISRQVGFRM